jgi:hypothetical protein
MCGAHSVSRISCLYLGVRRVLPDAGVHSADVHLAGPRLADLRDILGVHQLKAYPQRGCQRVRILPHSRTVSAAHTHAHRAC